MREPEVEARLREYLVTLGYTLVSRTSLRGHDVEAAKDGRRLVVEVKGDRPGHETSPGTIYVDACTLLGRIVLGWRQDEAEEYGIAVRPVHRRLLQRAMPALRSLAVKVWLVEDDGVRELT